MPVTEKQDLGILAGGLFALSGSLGGLASALTMVAYDHMAASANLCVPTSGHCLACVGALVCLAMALMAGGAGVSLFHRHAGPVRT